MKRYWLFEQEQYYPNGGMLDFIGDFDTLEELEKAKSIYDDAWNRRDLGHHILDTHERKILSGWNQFSKVVIKETPLINFK